MTERLNNLEIEKQSISHVALIMDGNRRWARQHNLPIIEGYREGERRMEPIVKRSQELGIQAVTFYTLSIDNLERPEEEVEILFSVFRNEVQTTLHRLKDEDVQFRPLGNINLFPQDLHDAFQKAYEETQDKKGIVLNLALAYSGRDEIKRAFQRLAKAGIKEEDITEQLISEHLDTALLPDPDFIIRTGDRYRLSDFLTWQGVYSEIHFTNILWPDFTVEEFNKSISWYQNQVRTFGR